ncbi:hypothetical protein D3C73_1195390 [compost metagenome]
MCIYNHPYCASVNANFIADFIGKGNLIIWSGRNKGIGYIPTRRNIDQIYPTVF